MKGRVLVVDDDAALAEMLGIVLRGEGFEPTFVADGDKALDAFRDTRPDLVLLDLMLPGSDGIDVCRQIRGESGVPIVMLTARHEAEARIEGLQIGADDYVAKPFEPRELALRINNILRRAAPPPVAETVEQVAFGPYVYHLNRGELRQGEEVIHLTDRERDMLRVLAAAPGETVPRGALTGNGSVNERAVDVQINRLRRKIEHDPASPLYLQAVRGIGYRLVASP